VTFSKKIVILDTFNNYTVIFYIKIYYFQVKEEMIACGTRLFLQRGFKNQLMLALEKWILNRIVSGHLQDIFSS
jgi:hypothetical protein